MEGFNNLLEKITPKLRAIAKRLDGKYMSFSDDDLFQEAVLNLWQRYCQSTIVEHTNSFILQGCYFFLKNYIRKSYKKIDRKSLSLEKIFADRNISLQNCLPVLEREEIRNLFIGRFLMEDVAKLLTEREKKVLTLKVNDYSTRQIAKHFGISHVMVVKITKRIREKCRVLSDNLR